jgi:DNA-binding LacI/PurR family transcriptional regulator
MLDSARPMTIGIVGMLRSRTRQSYGYFEEVLQGVLANAGNFDADVHIYRDNSWLWSGSNSPYQDGTCDGLILLSTACRPEVFGVVTASGLPVVSVGENVVASNISSVDVDNHGAAKAATEHLIKLGHTRIGTLTGRLLGDGWARLRFAGYLDALEDAGIPFDESIVADVAAPGFDGGYEATCMLTMKPRHELPTAIVALNDDIALAAMTRLKEVGLRVPDDISIIGFDDVMRAERSIPPLTTLRQPTQLIGVKAVDLMMKHIGHRHLHPQHITVPAELILRASTSAPPAISQIAPAKAA